MDETHHRSLKSIDIGCGGFLAALALLPLALAPAVILLSSGLYLLLMNAAPVVAGLGLICSLVDLGRGKRIAWVGLILAVVAFLTWFLVRKYFGLGGLTATFGQWLFNVLGALMRTANGEISHHAEC